LYVTGIGQWSTDVMLYVTGIGQWSTDVMLYVTGIGQWSTDVLLVEFHLHEQALYLVNVNYYLRNIASNGTLTFVGLFVNMKSMKYHTCHANPLVSFLYLVFTQFQKDSLFLFFHFLLPLSSLSSSL